MVSTPSIVAPGDRRSPTISPVTKYTTNCPADAWLLMERPDPQNSEEEMTKLVQDLSAAAAAATVS